MKNRLLAQILILCMMFSALPIAVRAADETTPSPYIEGALNSGQISATKSLTVIATSSDLYITKFALKAIDAGNGKVSNLEASSSLQVSEVGRSCYEYKQSFSLTRDLKVIGGKWIFEVTSTYKASKESSKTNSSSRMLPSDYEKAHWYSYYTIINDTPSIISPPDNPPAVLPGESVTPQPDNQPVPPPEEPKPDDSPVSPPDRPTTSQPDDSPVLPPEEPAIPQPDAPSFFPPDRPTASRPDDSPVLPPEESTIPQPDAPSVFLPDKPTTFQPNDSPALPPDEPTIFQPDIVERHPTDSTVNITAYFNKGTSAACVNASDIQKALNKTDHRGNVNINVDIPHCASVDSVQVGLPISVINSLANGTDKSLTVTTPLAVVTIPSNSLHQIGCGTNSFTISAAYDESNTLHIALIQDGQGVEELPSGLKVEIPINYTPRASGVVAVLASRDNAETILPKSVIKSNGNLAIQLDTGSAAINYQDRSKDFSDVSSNYWAADAINFVCSHGLFQGTTNTTFEGSIPMNRAMLVTVLHRLEGTPYAGTYSFADIPANSYYAQAAAWASSKDIIQGNGVGFSGNSSITRQEIVVMLYRYMQATNGSAGRMGSYYGMGDAEQVAKWADEAMRWAVGSGIIQGDVGNLKPKDGATRAEAAQMIFNFVRLITQ